MEGTAINTGPVLDGLRQSTLASNRLRAALAAELGVNQTELSALGQLAQAPGSTPKELAQFLGITTGSTTGTTEHLHKMGFLVREPHPQDRRSVQLSLTPAGRHAMEWAFERYASALGAALARQPETSPEEIARFFVTLADELDAIGAQLPGTPGR